MRRGSAEAHLQGDARLLPPADEHHLPLFIGDQVVLSLGVVTCPRARDEISICSLRARDETSICSSRARDEISICSSRARDEVSICSSRARDESLICSPRGWIASDRAREALGI